jgi:hypothetical protein
VKILQGNWVKLAVITICFIKHPQSGILDAVSCVSQASTPSQLNSQSSSAFFDGAVLLYGIPDNAENIYDVTNKVADRV